MSYDEHLISMAGGDGELDLDAIEARAQAAIVERESNFLDLRQFAPVIRAIDESSTDVPALLALVREQHAKLDRVEAVHKRRQFNPVADGVHFGQTEFDHNICDYDHERWPCPTIAAITATEEGKCRR